MSDLRVLLSTEDLKELYRLTNPKQPVKPKLLLVGRPTGGTWTTLGRHALRGYRACQSHLASRVRQYERSGHWPHDCEVGIGVFQADQLVKVLRAVDRGITKPAQTVTTTPLDDILHSMGTTRKDIGE